MSVFQTAVQLFPSYFSSFFPPNVGKTQFSQTSAWQSFLNDAGNNGFGLPNHFLVFFESPWLNEKYGFAQTGFDKRMTFRCFTVNVPTQMISTLDRDIGGPKRRIPYTSTFDDEVTMQFYCSPDMAEFGFVKKWMDGIIDPISRYVSYYDDFAKNTKATLLFIPNNVKSFEDIQIAYSQNRLRGLRFTELYPSSMRVNGGTLEWSSSTKPTFLSVGFGFREAVDITTYDKALNQQLQDLADIAANPLSSNLTKFMQDQGVENIAIDGNVMRNFSDSNQLLTNSEIQQSGQTRGLVNIPGNGELYADGGTVKTIDFGGLEAVPNAENGQGGQGVQGGIPQGTPFANSGRVSIA